MHRLFRIFAACMMASISIFAMYAFASSTSGAQAAGEGAVPITGWVISNLDYQFAENPSFVEHVTFDLNAPADKVEVSLQSGSDTPATCVHLGGYRWQCSFHAGVSVASMDEFRVIAVDN